MNREVFTQLEEAFARYFVVKDSADRYIVYGIIDHWVSKSAVVEVRAISALLARGFLSDSAFKILQGEEFFFIERKIQNILNNIANDHNIQSAA